MRGGGSNGHDKFIFAELAVYIAMRSDKTNAISVRRWLLKEVVPRGLNQMLQIKVEEQDTCLALLNDDLDVRDRQIIILKQEKVELQTRYVTRLEDSKKDNGMAIIQKYNGDTWPYLAICGQQGYVTQKIKNKLIDYPSGKIVVLAEAPNAIVH